MTCKAVDSFGRTCEYDYTHNNGEYLHHKSSTPAITELGFRGRSVYHWKIEKAKEE